ncbi:hypothetical protein [Longimicrobium sp.]|jgi:hypothetical protein|uniref:hypothetical protein n=1 Tax=Longimicrobium sp. TaxID=2029185 RepID=UPI002F928B73
MIDPLKLSLALLPLLAAAPAAAQTPAQSPPPPVIEQVRALGLDSLAAPLPVFHRPADHARAMEAQALLREAARFFADSLGLETRVHVAVLPKADWERVSRVPYGVPYIAGGVVFLPATFDGAISEDFRKLEPGASQAVRARVAATGVSFDENAARMTDLIGLHELGHSYAGQMGIRTHARWFSEFLASYFAYAFLERAAPRLAPSWNAMLQAKLESPTPAHTTLDDFERLYIRVGPENYNWYQAVFARQVAQVFRERGLGFIRAVQQQFPRTEGDPMPATAVMERLEQLHPGFQAWGVNIVPR